MKPQGHYKLVKPSIPYQCQRWLAVPILSSLSWIVLFFCGYHIYDSHNFITVDRAYFNSPRRTIKSTRSGKISKLQVSPNMYVKKGQVIGYLTPENLTEEKLNVVVRKNETQKIPILAEISGRLLPNSIPLEGIFIKSGDEIVTISSCKPTIDFIINQKEGKKITKGARVSFQIDKNTYKGRIELIQPYRSGRKINYLTYREPLGRLEDLQRSNMRGLVELDAASEVQFHENIGACNLDITPFAVKILK